MGANKAKSERQGGRMLMMKTRLTASNNQADLGGGGTFQSTKNGSLARGCEKPKNHTGTQQL